MKASDNTVHLERVFQIVIDKFEKKLNTKVFNLEKKIEDALILIKLIPTSNPNPIVDAEVNSYDEFALKVKEVKIKLWTAAGHKFEANETIRYI